MACGNNNNNDNNSDNNKEKSLWLAASIRDALGFPERPCTGGGVCASAAWHVAC